MNKIIFKFDLLLCSAWALFVLHLWVANLLTAWCVEEATAFPEWTLPLVAYTVMMRLSLSFMILREEKRGWQVALVVLICGVVCYTLLPGGVMADAQRDMYNYAMVAVNYAFSPRWITTELPPYSCWRAWNFCLPIWLWGMPLLYFLIFRKRLTHETELPQTLWNGLYIWNDPLRERFLTYCGVCLVAWCIGIVMNEWLSLATMLVLSVYALYYINRINGRKPHWTEFICVAFSAGSLWYAQYVPGSMRDVWLVASALTAFVPMLCFGIKTQKRAGAVLAFVMVGILLPSFCLGYDVYTAKHTVRVQNFRDSLCITGLLKVRDTDGKVGLRDRYRIILPTSYDDLQPNRLPLVNVKAGEKWDVRNASSAGYAKGDYDLLGNRQFLRKIKIFLTVE